MDNNIPTTSVLDGGDNSGGRIVYFDARDPESVRYVLGSAVSMSGQPSEPGPAPAHYFVRFLVSGGGHVRQLLAQEHEAIARRRQAVPQPAAVVDVARTQWDLEREYSAKVRDFFERIEAARSVASSLWQEAERLATAGEDAREVSRRARDADDRAQVLEKARDGLKKPADRQRQQGDAWGQAVAAVDRKIAAEVAARRDEARRRLASATFKDADGVEVPLGQLLVEVALADELARQIGNMGLGRS